MRTRLFVSLLAVANAQPGAGGDMQTQMQGQGQQGQTQSGSAQGMQKPKWESADATDWKADTGNKMPEVSDDKMKSLFAGMKRPRPEGGEQAGGGTTSQQPPEVPEHCKAADKEVKDWLAAQKDQVPDQTEIPKFQDKAKKAAICMTTKDEAEFDAFKNKLAGKTEAEAREEIKKKMDENVIKGKAEPMDFSQLGGAFKDIPMEKKPKMTDEMRQAMKQADDADRQQLATDLGMDVAKIPPGFGEKLKGMDSTKKQEMKQRMEKLETDKAARDQEWATKKAALQEKFKKKLPPQQRDRMASGAKPTNKKPKKMNGRFSMMAGGSKKMTDTELNTDDMKTMMGRSIANAAKVSADNVEVTRVFDEDAETARRLEEVRRLSDTTQSIGVDYSVSLDEADQTDTTATNLQSLLESDAFAGDVVSEVNNSDESSTVDIVVAGGASVGVVAGYDGEIVEGAAVRMWSWMCASLVAAFVAMFTL